ncbi:MAG: response regulator [Prevotellaceae bacterium]|jgi:signal transduction histidine kinase/ligand-binding sensor domain-containing protein/DNA-binding response OmpR family regulator|nr:response regulator [Prevotellaceae bacterium]
MRPNVHLLTCLLIANVLSFASCKQPSIPTETAWNVQNSLIVANDLSNQRVTSFAEDTQGHIWIGTYRGLNKYDTRLYYQHFTTADSTTLPDNQINDLLCDTKGRLWVATVNGVARYTEEGNFHRIQVVSKTNNCSQLLENDNGRIFLNLVTELCVYNEETGVFDMLNASFDPYRTFLQTIHIDNNDRLWSVNPYFLHSYDSNTMEPLDTVATNTYVHYAYLWKDRYFWLAHENSLLIYDTEKQTFIDTPAAIRNNPKISRSRIQQIHPYGEDALLLSTSGGLFLYDNSEDRVIWQHDGNFPLEIPAFQVTTMYTDTHQNLWLGSVDHGYSVSYYYKTRFNNNNYLRSELSGQSVIGISADNNQRLWLITSQQGMYMYDMATPRMQRFREIQDASYIFVDQDNDIWLTSFLALNRYVYQDGKLILKQSYPIFRPMCLTQDANGTVWVSTYTEYVFAMRKDETEFTRIQVHPLGYNFISAIRCLSDGTILTASFRHGLHLIDPDTYKITVPAISNEDWNDCIRMSTFIPTDVFEDSQGDVWIGTMANGLLKWERRSGRLTPFVGLSCMDVAAITEDLEENIWVSTQYGLNRIDPTDGSIMRYYTADGIGGNQFYDRIALRSLDGTVLFGGTHGVTSLNPVDITEKRNIPLLFEDLKIHNRLVAPRKDGTIDKLLAYKPRIRLNWNQNSFSISFAALDYSEYARVQYAYRMEGFDQTWINTSDVREAYYSNMPAGKYTLHVKITNNDRTIVEAAESIDILIRPAPWRSGWAYTGYVLVALAFIAWLYQIGQRNIRNRKLIAQAKWEKAQEEKINRMNMSFFANVSHEFRTPLTMIAGPVSQLFADPSISDTSKKLLKIVQRNTERMLKIVNQILDFNKLENDTLKLQVKRADIVSELKHIIEMFQANIEQKNLRLLTSGLEEIYITWLDADKLEKIVITLLSNAIKFTPGGGYIRLSFDVISAEKAAKLFPAVGQRTEQTAYVKVAVSDTGIGIPEQELENVFDRYYQLENGQKGVYNYGTGIGLYYARSLTELHHGYIKAENRPDGGTRFTFILPVADTMYPSVERQEESDAQEKVYPLHVAPADVTVVAKSSTHSQSPTILVVDDDIDVVQYLQLLLSQHYEVICRFNAADAYKTLEEKPVDLVLSDVVMPGTDGFLLCRQIKQNTQFCHIPVILITAKSATESQVEGLNMGADAYVTKPFDPAYLIALVNSQLKNRDIIRNVLVNSTQTDKMDKHLLSPQDEAFMTELYMLMEAELSNSELNTIQMTEKMHMSRTKFYYKVKGLTGENPAVFFKTYKLNRAKELLMEGKHNVSEVADLTGFSTLSHFSTLFKKQFGVIPSKVGKSS